MAIHVRRFAAQAALLAQAALSGLAERPTQAINRPVLAVPRVGVGAGK